MNFLMALILFLSTAQAAKIADYNVLPGKLHRKGKIVVSILPDKEKYRVKMEYDVKKKEFVPVPGKLLRGTTVMEFPEKFRTEAGYQELEKKNDDDHPQGRIGLRETGRYRQSSEGLFF